jgi:hypothetical protein
MASIDQLGIRWLTALVIVAASALAVSRGWDIIRFCMADSVVGANLGPNESQHEAVRPWVDVSGLAFDARDSLVTPVADSSDEVKARKRRDELMEILSIRPLSSKYWLWLAETRLVTEENSSKVADALRLSVLSGANEGLIMGRRGLFGVWQWEALPPELRRRAAVDLAANPRPLSVGQISWLREALSVKAETVRGDIRTALLAEGFSAKAITAIGL